MPETKENRGRTISPEATAERRRRWQQEVDASGLLPEQIAYAIRLTIPTVRAFVDGREVPTVSAINALARRNASAAEAVSIEIGFFDDDPES